MANGIGCSFCIPRPGCGDCAKRSMGKERARADEMEPKLIKTEDEYGAALAQVDALMSARPGTAEGNALELWAHLIEDYEEEHYLIPAPEPVEAIRFRMEQQNLKPRVGPGHDNAIKKSFIGEVTRLSQLMDNDHKHRRRMMGKKLDELLRHIEEGPNYAIWLRGSVAEVRVELAEEKVGEIVEANKGFAISEYRLGCPGPRCGVVTFPPGTYRIARLPDPDPKPKGTQEGDAELAEEMTVEARPGCPLRIVDGGPEGWGAHDVARFAPGRYVIRRLPDPKPKVRPWLLPAIGKKFCPMCNHRAGLDVTVCGHCRADFGESRDLPREAD